jgi:hypothetical protein
MKKVILLTVLVLLISLAYSFADVPCKINYQGRLIENNVPVDGTKTMKFTIYNSLQGGDELWTSGEVDVTVYNGLFRYVLGSDGEDLSSIPWTAGETLYLEVKVGDDILTPREPLYAYPYAISSLLATDSQLLEGKTKEYFLNTSADSQTKQGNLNIVGNLGIGTMSPAGPLEVKADNQGSLVLRLSNKTNGSSMDFWSYGIQSVGENLYLRSGSGKGLSLGVDGTDNKLYINTSGNVGIGTTNPGEKLTVAGTIESTTGGVKFPDGSLQTTAAGGFGSWASKSLGTTYTAGSDGIVIAYSTQMDAVIRGFTPAATLRVRIGYLGYGSAEALTMPVRKGDTWKVTCYHPTYGYGTPTIIWWLPIGD